VRTRIQRGREHTGCAGERQPRKPRVRPGLALGA
jgi:hypothetical protein